MMKTSKCSRTTLLTIMHFRDGRQSQLKLFLISFLNFRIGSQSFNSFAIFDAIFLNPIEVPVIRLNLTPLSESLGSLHTSISPV